MMTFNTRGTAGYPPKWWVLSLLVGFIGTLLVLEYGGQMLQQTRNSFEKVDSSNVVVATNSISAQGLNFKSKAGKYSEVPKERARFTMRAPAEVHTKHTWKGPEEPAAIDCPKGKYRGENDGLGTSTTNWEFTNDMGCIDCPRGRYGSSTGLTSSSCTFPCPKGRYGYRAGATSEDDCWHCPPGTYGSKTGLTEATCSGSCPSGKYSNEWGLTLVSDCEDCPVEYRGWQCRSLWKIIDVKTTSSD